MKIRFLYILVFISFSLHNVFSQDGWKVSLEKDAVRVWTREVADSKFKEYKGEILVKCSLSCLVALLDDVDNQKNWLYDCTESKNLSIINKTEGVNYFVQTAP